MRGMKGLSLFSNNLVENLKLVQREFSNSINRFALLIKDVEKIENDNYEITPPHLCNPKIKGYYLGHG